MLLFLISSWALVQSASRGAWLGAFGGMLLAAAFIPGFLRRKTTWGFLLIAVFFFVFLFSTSALVQERMEGLFSGESSHHRLDAWLDCWEYFLKSPVWGYGIGAYGVMDRVRDEVAAPHNFFFSILLEMGLVGLCAYLFFFFLILRRILFFSGNYQYRPVFIGIFSTILIYGQFDGSIISDKIFLSCMCVLISMIWERKDCFSRF